MTRYYQLVQQLVPVNDLPYFVAFSGILNSYYSLPSISSSQSYLQIGQYVSLQYRQLAGLRGYLGKILQAVTVARQNLGLTVILSMNEQEGRVADDWSTTPVAATISAWSLLAPYFANDTGVMLELYNEPVYSFGSTWTSASEPAIWNLWQNGDGRNIVSHQALVDLLRNNVHAKNVILVDGVQAAAWVSTYPSDPMNANGVPLNSISDALHSIVYAVHPYPDSTGNNNTLWRWENNFGDFAASHPVIASEWMTSSLIACRPVSPQGETAQADGTVSADSPLIAYDFLKYAKALNIGVVGWAFDYPNQLIAAATFGAGSFSYRVTTYRKFLCDPGADTGSAMLNSYAGGGGLDLQGSWQGTLTYPVLSQTE
jgi:hypothetical protein